MLGAIIGDMVGSVYERSGIKTKDFPLFGLDSSITDDTVMTVAIAEGVMNGANTDAFITAMKKYGRLYPQAGYGERFDHWLFSDDTAPYYSWGNGAAMRVSPIAWSFNKLDEVETYAALSAAVTHNHPEGIKGAQATAASVFLARKGKSKNEIKKYISNQYGYSLDRSLNEIRPTYSFFVSCQKTVPEAITAFLESTDFEDAVRNAVSLGGDSDTLAAITGSIAEGTYGIPVEIKEKALSLLDKTLFEAYYRFRTWINNKG